MSAKLSPQLKTEFYARCFAEKIKPSDGVRIAIERWIANAPPTDFQLARKLIERFIERAARLSKLFPTSFEEALAFLAGSENTKPAE